MLTTDTALRKATPASKPFRISDGAGLYLLVQPNGSKWWRFDYRRPTTGRNTLSFGVYPDVSRLEEVVWVKVDHFLIKA
jgi:hypothetical protein